MTADIAFRNLIQRIRNGDQEAATELVRLYEPEIRRAIRVRHTDPRLRRNIDSGDIAQSVMANFFVRVAAGQFELDHPDQLLRLLVTMARNKLYDQARRQKADRRSNRRMEPDGHDRIDQLPAQQDTPSQEVALKELLVKLKQSLTEEERQLAEQRASGRDWAEIAAEQGVSPEALRKRLSRAIDRIAPQLGLMPVREE